jgi:citrate synthase
MIPWSACQSWPPDRAANAAQEHRSYTTPWDTIDNLPHRRQIFLWLIMFGVFWAGFSAWREEKDQWLATKSALDKTKRELASQPTRAAQDINRLRQQLADQSAQTSQLQQRLAYLTADRHLTPKAMNTLAKLLTISDNATHKIVIGDLSMGCADCGIYAEDFATTFRLAQWTVQQINYADLDTSQMRNGRRCGGPTCQCSPVMPALLPTARST